MSTPRFSTEEFLAFRTINFASCKKDFAKHTPRASNSTDDQYLAKYNILQNLIQQMETAPDYTTFATFSHEFHNVEEVATVIYFHNNKKNWKRHIFFLLLYFDNYRFKFRNKKVNCNALKFKFWF